MATAGESKSKAQILSLSKIDSQKLSYLHQWGIYLKKPGWQRETDHPSQSFNAFPLSGSKQASADELCLSNSCRLRGGSEAKKLEKGEKCACTHTQTHTHKGRANERENRDSECIQVLVKMTHNSQLTQVKETEEGNCAVAQQLEKKSDCLLVWFFVVFVFGFFMFRSKGQ